MGELHPRRLRPQIQSESQRTGLNRDTTTYPETSYIRCSRCGFILNTARHPKGYGSGVTNAETQLNGAVTAGDTTITVDSTTGFTTPATGSITAFENNWSGTKVTASSHGLKGGKVTISSTTNYNGTFYIQDVLDDSFVIQKKYVADDATGTWTVPENIYIYDAGTYETDEDVGSTYTAATNSPAMNKVSYTGLSSTTFTGCSGATAHDDNMYVRGSPEATSGCPLCGSYEYD